MDGWDDDDDLNNLSDVEFDHLHGEHEHENKYENDHQASINKSLV